MSNLPQPRRSSHASTRGSGRFIHMSLPLAPAAFAGLAPVTFTGRDKTVGGSEMRDQGRTRPQPTEPWKRKMGVEFSGLENTRDFIVALGCFALLVAVAAAVAFVAFG